MKRTESNLYQELTEAEKLKIQESAQQLTSLLSIWVSQYPIIRANRVVPVAALVATVLPDFPVHLSLLVGKLILFIFAVDDVADERLLSYNEFRAASKFWEAIARDGTAGQPFLPEGDLNGIVWELHQELAQMTLFPDLRDLWADRLRLLCEAMSKEYEYGLTYTAGGKEMLPELGEYIQGGIHSVGFPFWGTSVLILLDEPDMLNNLETVNEIILQTGAAIRLYNDIRTYEKEVQENNINAIHIVDNRLTKNHPELSPADRLQQAQQTVLGLAQKYAGRSKELAAQPHPGTGRFEKMIARIIDFHAFFYGSHHHQHDYHTISSSDTLSMMQGE